MAKLYITSTTKGCLCSWAGNEFSNQKSTYVFMQKFTIFSLITCDALKFIPNRMSPCAFVIDFLAIFYFTLQNSHEKTFKMMYTRCLYIVI